MTNIERKGVAALIAIVSTVLAVVIFWCAIAYWLMGIWGIAVVMLFAVGFGAFFYAVTS